MKELSKALILVKFFGLALIFFSTIMIFIFAHSQHLSYFSYLCFTHQETIKSGAIIALFVGVFFLFYSGSKVPQQYLKVILFKGAMKAHPDMIKSLLQNFFDQEKIINLKLLAVHINQDNKIALEIKTSSLQDGLLSLEEIEAKLKSFMESQLGLNHPVEVELFET